MTTVLMTADTVGGVWTYALELADALRPYGVEVALATMGRPMDVAQRQAVARSSVGCVYESTFPLEWMDDPWGGVDDAGRWLLELERTLRPDVVHLNGYAHGALPWRSPTVVVGHSCVLSWRAAVDAGASGPSDVPAHLDEYRQRVAAGLGAADAVVAPTQAMLTELQRWYGLDGGTVIHNGRRPIHGGGIKEPLVLSVGRLWDEGKNVAALDRVAGRLEWPVAVAGDRRHPAGGTWEPTSVQALGQLDEEALGDWLARASIFALPARYEPFGLGALEAARAGCALVLGDIASLREVWGDAAVFVDPESSEALEAALRELIADPAAVTDLSAAAQRRARRYIPDAMASAYADLYRRVQRRDAAAAIDREAALR